MTRIPLILALCAFASAPRADTQFTPWVFDLRKQFDACIKTDTDNLFASCQDVIMASYTLRREIGYALDACQSTNVEGCVTAFNAAGFPAERLHIATLKRCTQLDRLKDIDILEIPENACIEQLANSIEENNIPTTHNTEVSCGINYIECAEILAKGADYWEKSVWLQQISRLQTIPNSTAFRGNTGHRYYSLLERQLTLQIDLAQTNCNIQTVVPHWANTMDYDGCMGEAYAQMWQRMQSE